MLKYYEMEDDLHFKDRWHINELYDQLGIQIDSREFCGGKRFELGSSIKAVKWKDGNPYKAKMPLTIMLDGKRSGRPMDFTFSNEDLPVASKKISELLYSIVGDDVQRIPLYVESENSSYEIINVTRMISCLDPRLSIVQWYQPGNEVRPDLAGEPEMVAKLVIDPSIMSGHHICRITNWESPIIVSSIVKNEFESAGVTGITFSQVSP